MTEGDDERTVTIPIHQSGDEVIRHAEVNADWWEYNTRVKAVFEELLEEYGPRQAVDSLEIVCCDENHSNVDRHKQKIVLYTSETTDPGTQQSIENDVPDGVDGISVDVTTTRA